MSELATSARPYAVAAFKRAKETAAMQSWSQGLAFMAAVIGSGDISGVVDNPKIGKQSVATLLLDICQGQLDEEAANFLKLLVQNGRLPLLPTIAKLFEEYKAEYEGYLDVQVTSAYELSEAAHKGLADTLEKSLGKKINMNVAVDKSLIGGVLVRAGDQVIDGSIRGRLQHMQKTLQ
ncbi:F0F1 ATP synthase subunit delta [Methylovulum psychrotolerans]|jgi:F-type H+-transporting ATPase subunit delta|uniref:ATP synthase subunit delta n=1 Tax=Methylovulum psychrotolerans TaxID=1704499 RepID=A0A1Z4BVF3_9GAMM|nr:F0F1 ATP synthase subunit delta [Methylovulum psychrotolerans]ASF45284.1 F0F1 ATP synthase subunit delta [Methylovulum psychrotolerans]MBT9096548.1 F0F1 ATP synthase subunit delta [Methylovulum psychrotolerans]POZ53253.1 F0F1 ATP synthase subunit delta [Methylovulum psychrotolerans]